MSVIDIYWWLAVVSSGIMGILLLLNIFGFDIDEVDVDFGGDHFSINSLVAMICVGGWTGYLGSTTTQIQPWVILSISITAGLSAYIGSIFILRKLKSWESKGNFRLENAIGCTGNVYLSIPENESGSGQIQAVIQGRLQTLYAKTEKRKLETGEPVIIYDVKDRFVYVEHYNET